MGLPDVNEFRLAIPALMEFETLVHDFLGRVVAFADIDDVESKSIIEAVSSALIFIEAGLEADHDIALPIELEASVDSHSLTIGIRETGAPQDDGSWQVEKGVSHSLHEVFDEVHWIQLGALGSELRLRRHRPHPEISTLVEVHHRLETKPLDHVADSAGGASGSEATPTYDIRRFQDGDEIEVARQFYESYGRSYPNPDLLYPARIRGMNGDGRLHSIVVENGDGVIGGHYGIERPDLGMVGEAGLAVIDPSNRGHGLLEKMRAFLVEEARGLDLLGLWSQPTARHPYSQKMNIKFGSTLCGLSLGTTPADVTLRGSEDEENPTRHSCFLYWLPLAEEPHLTASVPESMASLLGELYQARARGHRFETALVPPGSSEENAATVRGRFNRARRSGTVTVSRVDHMTLPLVRQLVSDLLEISGAEVIYADLPITDRSCAWLAEALVDDGFVLCGVGPRFLDGEDALRLQRLAVPLDFDELVVEGDLARRVTDFITNSPSP